jgi:hypothetical protein
MATYLTGPLQLGTGLDNTAAATGYVMQSQTGLITFDATLVQNLSFTIPANSQITDIYVDVLTAYNSATSATLSAGTATGGTTYLSGINAKTAGRASNAFSAAQLAAIDDIGSTTTLVATVTSVGQPTAGQARVTVVYAQK